MQIAVTGATGQLGALVIAALVRRVTPQSVTAIVRDAGKAGALRQQGVTIREAGYGDTAALDAALQGVDRLLLISGNEVGQRVAQHANVIEVAKRAGVGLIVYTSAPKADSTALVLAPEHKATEALIRASGIPFTILRNNWYTENYVAQVAEARASGEIVNSVGSGRIASATRADFAEAAAVVLTGEGHEGKTYELGGDTAWSFDEFAQVVSGIVGRPVSYRAISPDEERERLIANGVPEGGADFVVALNANIANGDLATVTGDLSRLIGRPTTPLDPALRAALA